jgi:hypothetical protein
MEERLRAERNLRAPVSRVVPLGWLMVTHHKTPRVLRIIYTSNTLGQSLRTLHANRKVVSSAAELMNEVERLANSSPDAETRDLARALLHSSDLVAQIAGYDSEGDREIQLKEFGSSQQNAVSRVTSLPLIRDDTAPPGRLPRFWRLFSYILPKQTRVRVFEPAYNDMLEDYATRGKYRTKWAKRWLAFCFTWHTAWMVVECVASMLSDKALALVRRLWPGLVLWWWLRK